MSEFLAAALAYAGLGLHVIPLHGKKPYFENWPQVATSDPVQILRWWTQNPDDNIGVATGKASGVFVLDVDKQNGGEDALETLILRHGRFPDTWQDITGRGGFHMFFRYPSFPVGNAPLVSGIDIRGDGGQVVVPPSIHPDTKKHYIWDGLDDISRDNIAEAPVWLLDMLQAKHGKPMVREVPSKIPYGTQHLVLLSIAGKMRRMGLTSSEIFAALWKINCERCEKPPSAEHVQQIADSMMRYAPDDKGVIRASLTIDNELQRLQQQKAQAQKKAEDRKRTDPWEASKLDGLEVYNSAETNHNAIVERFLTKGYTLLAGRAKGGKSVMGYQLSLCVANGVPIRGLEGRAVLPGKVLHVALEDGQVRTRSRLHKLLLDSGDDRLRNIEFRFASLPFEQGGRQQLEKRVEEMRPTLVLVDTLRAIVNGGSTQEKTDVVGTEYRWAEAFHHLAQTYDAAVVVLHHTNAAGGVAGTYAMSAGADSIWKLKRDVGSKQGTLEIMGRDTEDTVLSVEFSGDPYEFGWRITGEGNEVGSQPQLELKEILEHEGPQTLNQLCVKTGKKYCEVMRLCKQMNLPMTAERKFYVQIQRAEAAWATKSSPTLNA